MSATDAFETALLTLYFINTAHADIGDAGGIQPSVTDGDFYISLHTSDPGETGDQTTNEASYTGYARVAVARGTGWTVSGSNASNTAEIPFDPCVSGTDTVTHFGIGSDLSGAGNLHFKGTLGTPRAISAGVTPSFAAGALDVNLD